MAVQEHRESKEAASTKSPVREPCAKAAGTAGGAVCGVVAEMNHSHNGKGRLEGMLESLAPLDIGEPVDGGKAAGEPVGQEVGSAHEEEHGDVVHFASLQSPQIKPSRDPFVLSQLSPKGGKGSPGNAGGVRRSNSVADMKGLTLEEEDETSSQSSAEDPPPLTPGKIYVLEHTTGTVKEDGGAHVGGSHDKHTQAMRRSHSTLDVRVITDSEMEEEEDTPQKPPGKPAEHLLVVLDMDHTMVGNLVALSDRDNVESNIDWDWWPEGQQKGLSVEQIVPYLQRGMLRPGLIAALTTMRDIGATVIVYTHSEYRWAVKVCEAMEQVVGFKFVFKLFSRHDCKDGHPEFLAKKSLEYVVNRLKEDDGLHWASVDTAIMFDDDKKALFPGEIGRLVVVPSYDYWEPCQWDEVITEDVLSRNSEDVVDLVRRTVVEWGVAKPSYGKAEEELTEHDRETDEKWQVQKEKKRGVLTSYNKLCKLDRLWANIKSALTQVAYFDEAHMEAFPDKVRKAIGGGGAKGRGGLF